MIVDPFRKEAKRLIAQGADPRQAGEAAVAYFGLPRAISVREGFKAGVALGACVVMALAGTGAWMFNLRPAGGAVAVPSTSDAAASSRQTATNDPTPAAQLGVALSPVPVEQRPAVLAELVKLTSVLRNPVTLTILRTIRDLSEQDRIALAQDARLGPVLAWTARLTTDQQKALLTTNLQPVLADPSRLALLQVLPKLDPLSADVLATLTYATYAQRQTLMAVLQLIETDDGHFDRLIAAFSNAAPSLLKVLEGKLINCQFSNREGCR